MKYFLPVLFVTLLFFGCDDDKKSSEKKSAQWQLNKHFNNYDKIIQNAHVYNDTYYIAGLMMLAKFEDDTTKPTFKNGFNGNFSLNHKPAMKNSMIMYKLSDSKLKLNDLDYCSSSSNSAGNPFIGRLDINDLEPNFSENVNFFYLSFSNSIGAFNNQNQFLTYVDDPGEDSTSGVNGFFVLINLNPNIYSWYNYLDCMQINPTIITIPHDLTYHSGSAYLRFIDSFEDTFFVDAESGFLVINSSGGINKIDNVQGHMLDVFDFKSNLYAVTDFGHIYISKDKGKTWDLFAEHFLPSLSEFFIVQDKVCFYRNSNLYHVDLETGVITELNNSNLEGNEITSVNEFKGRVWITTLSGLFYKDVSSFFDVKEPDEKRSRSKRITVENLKLIK